MILVKRCTEEDLADALLLARLMHSESPLHNSYRFDPAKVEQLVRNAIVSEDWLPILAYSDGKPIGMALMVVAEMFYGPDKECLDLVFYVEPRSRGSSAAFRLVTAIELWASDKDAQRIAIGIHNGINHEEAARFFEKLLYRRQGILVEKSVH